jgi:glycosyltransferase involved in cell wall biosynthesis
VKILHVINGLDASGAEIMLLNLARKLNEYGVEQEVVTLLQGGSLVERVRDAGLTVRHLGMRQGIPSLRAFRSLGREIQRAKPDLVVAWMYHSCFAASLAAPRNLPVVWSIHHTLSQLEQEKLLTRLLIKNGPRLKKRVARYVYVSQTSARHHLEVGYPEDNYEVIPNGFDLSAFQSRERVREGVRAELGLSAEQVVFGSAARFHPMKNHVGLIESFSAVAKDTPDAVLLLVGRGVDEANTQLQQALERGGIQGRVLLLGERSDMTRIMNGIDVYVSASMWGESFPMVLGEAMASGIPCVTTDLGDCANIIADTGRVVAPGDDMALQEAMRWMIKQGAEGRKLLGIKARSRIEENFSLDRVAEQYLLLCKNVVSEA